MGGMVAAYRAPALKLLLDRERSGALRKRATLRFSTCRHGRVYQVTLAVPCPLCCQGSAHVQIACTPDVDGIDCDADRLLLEEDPLEFVKTVIWKWIDYCSLNISTQK